jgi:predicted permease
MSLASITLNQIIIMIIIMLIGYISYKLKIIDEAGNKILSNILLVLITPIVIFTSYQRDFTMDLFQGLMISLILAVITHVVGIIVAYIVLRGKSNPDIVIERFSTIFSNCGFIGIPLAYGIYGSEGVFYITAYITIFNLILWTFGVNMMTGNTSWKSMLKALVSPTIITILIGIIFFLLQIRIPNTILEALNSIGSMNTPLAMLIAGISIGNANLLKLFGNLRTYLVAVLKLLVIPIVLVVLYSRFNISDAVVATAVLAAACPTGSTGTLFALRYDKNAVYASELFVVTTILSALSIPLIMMLLERLI